MGVVGRFLQAAGVRTRIPQWTALGLSPEEERVEVRLRRPGREPEALAACSIASLMPLRLVVGLPGGAPPGPSALVFTAPEGQLLAELELQPLGELADLGLWTCEVTGHQNLCVPRPSLHWTYARFELDRLRARKTRDGFRIGGLDLWGCLAFYTRPRPVVLVSIQGESPVPLLFPMDLIGAGERGLFLMALRSTSLSTRLMRESRQIAMAELPPELKDVAYAFAGHHKAKPAPGTPLPFPTITSPTFGLTLPASAVRIREVRVERVETVGSHQLFCTRIVHEGPPSSARRLFHTSGFYGEFLRDHGQLQPA